MFLVFMRVHLSALRLVLREKETEKGKETDRGRQSKREKKKRKRKEEEEERDEHRKQAKGQATRLTLLQHLSPSQRTLLLWSL